MTTDELAARLDEKFTSIDQHFDRIDQHFVRIDQRFASIDQRFASIDQRFASIDQRFASIDQRFDRMDQRFEALEKNVEDGFNASKVRDEELRGLMTFGFEARDVLRDEMRRRFDEAARQSDEQMTLLRDAVRHSLGGKR